VWALERELRGPFNAVAPHPVTNAQLMAALRAALHRPWSPPVPAPMVKIGAMFMGTEAEHALNSTRITPRRFLELGFQFRFPDLASALDDLYPRLHA
jgi:NAD dependent epimerase/dehydratase family enzyme